MKFFLPAADSDAQAERVLQNIKDFAAEQTGWRVLDRRIYKVHYRYDGKDAVAEVNKLHGRIGELVIAILESQSGSQKVYLVCSPNRGVIRGAPMLVGENQLQSVEYFDGY